jgi:hypothetical protein
MHTDELATLELECGLCELAAEGLRCALAAIRGVRSVTLATGEATAVVCFDPSIVRPNQFRMAARALGCRVRRIVLAGTEETTESGEARLPVSGAALGAPAPV